MFKSESFMATGFQHCQNHPSNQLFGLIVVTPICCIHNKSEILYAIHGFLESG